MRILLTPLLALAVAACGEGGTDPETASMSGQWEGSTFGVSATATLTETDRAISGSGTITTPQGTIPTSITGTNDHPDVSLTIRAPGQPEGAFSGTFTDRSRVAGNLTIAGLPQVPITLRRRP